MSTTSGSITESASSGACSSPLRHCPTTVTPVRLRDVVAAQRLAGERAARADLHLAHDQPAPERLRADDARVHPFARARRERRRQHLARSEDTVGAGERERLDVLRLLGDGEDLAFVSGLARGDGHRRVLVVGAVGDDRAHAAQVEAVEQARARGSRRRLACRARAGRGRRPGRSRGSPDRAGPARARRRASRSRRRRERRGRRRATPADLAGEPALEPALELGQQIEGDRQQHQRAARDLGDQRDRRRAYSRQVQDDADDEDEAERAQERE